MTACDICGAAVLYGVLSTCPRWASASEPAVWQWTHADCVPAEHDYRIDGWRLESADQRAAWREHLTQKRWFGQAEWDTAMAKVPGGK